jgi:hypothetical protein
MRWLIIENGHWSSMFLSLRITFQTLETMKNEERSTNYVFVSLQHVLFSFCHQTEKKNAQQQQQQQQQEQQPQAPLLSFFIP